jgi:protein-L-isoaspartate(D-aspartate) O-methyltransferase
MGEDYLKDPQHMLATIRAYASYFMALTGKTGFNDRVLKALGTVPRHEFVPVEVQPYAYENMPLPIGFGKTISQPFMVAVMTDLLDLQPKDTVLEIGTGLGYQAAVLAELCGGVYSVEVIDELARRAVKQLKRQGYTNIEVRVGNGYSGWPEHAPFDKVIVTDLPAESRREDGDPGRPARHSAACCRREGTERQDDDEANNACSVLAAGGG